MLTCPLSPVRNSVASFCSATYVQLPPVCFIHLFVFSSWILKPAPASMVLPSQLVFFTFRSYALTVAVSLVSTVAVA